MKTVIRYDKTNTASFTRTDEGYLLVDGIAVTPGLLKYQNADGSERIELIDAGEIKASMDSLKLKPVTLLHPSGMVGPKNIKSLAVGTVGEVDIREDDALGVRFSIADAEAISKADKGMRALSLGYTVSLDMTPGVHPEHGRYDAVQRGRRYNHLAIVPSGRSSGAGFRLDADDNLVKEVRMKDKTKTDEHGGGSVDCCSDEMKLCCAKMKLCCDKMCRPMSAEEYAICCQEMALCCAEMLKCCGGTSENMDGSKKPAPKPEAKPEDEKAKKKTKKDMDDLKARLDAAQSFDTLMAWHVSRSRLDGLAMAQKVDIAKLDSTEASKAILKAAGVDVSDKSGDYIEARIDALSELKPNPYTGIRRSKTDEKPQTKVDPLDTYKTQFKGNK